MAAYRYDVNRVEEALRTSVVVVIMHKSHIGTPEHLVTTMKAVYEAGYICECTFRIDTDLLAEGMRELVSFRDQCPPEKPFVMGVGSIINPAELELAIDMGFDMIVAPGDVMGGWGDGGEFVRIAHKAGRFCAPAVFTPTELGRFLERGDGNNPDCIKIFPARTHGPKGISDLLAPFVRDRHAGKLIMPTGAVNIETAPEYYRAITGRGFTPILGMSVPLQPVIDRRAPGNADVLRESLESFRDAFEKSMRTAGINR